jgi:hypothetical protein
MNTFKDLEFRPHLNHHQINGIQAVVKFENGYGASVVNHTNSYGGKSGLYELAVLKDGLITYDSPITNDVLGWLNEDEVTNFLTKIQQLTK